MASEQFDAVLAEMRAIAESDGCATDWRLREWADRLAAAHAAEVGELRKLLGQCFAIAGADTDGDPPERRWDRAVRAVTDLRRDYDEACEELHGANGWKPRAEAAERDARRYRSIRNPPPRGDAMCAWSTTEDGELSERGEHDGPLTGDALDHAIDHPIVPDGAACIGGGEG